MKKGTILRHVSGYGPLYSYVETTPRNTYILCNTENGQITEWEPVFFEEKK